ncbi:hypothetical protein F2P44_32165 [Massilia sp. CCM 8695]|uniref:Uncharacterized protein n=1 Tax=Massilia frigida TaxID=2609281 RepID=A0ABX0NK73_9BURK|nr:hypothetical protein [Massilia frigida]NHZ83890.1 hypothetical protein [Massilia frigida]
MMLAMLLMAAGPAMVVVREDDVKRDEAPPLPGSKVRRHYLHHDYADEKHDAWAKLGTHMTMLLK